MTFEEAVLLRIFLGENDRCDGQPLYQAIVLKARELGLAGATVLRGPLGFGDHSHLHTAKILRLSEDLPVVIEIVDTEDRIRTFVEEVEPMVDSGLITLEKATVPGKRGMWLRSVYDRREAPTYVPGFAGAVIESPGWCNHRTPLTYQGVEFGGCTVTDCPHPECRR